MKRMKYRCRYKTPEGFSDLVMESDGEYLTALLFEGSKDTEKLAGEYGEEKLPVFFETARWLDVYFSGKDPGFTPPLKTNGTPFRQQVWEILLTIPYGQTVSYGRIAEMLSAQRSGRRTSARAVGGAVGHNPIQIIVPCHRVVGTNGSMTGYAGGIDRKIRLLALEKVSLS